VKRKILGLFIFFSFIRVVILVRSTLILTTTRSFRTRRILLRQRA
jgi:hypothetical protein